MSGFFDLLSKTMDSGEEPQQGIVTVSKAVDPDTAYQKFGKTLSSGIMAGGATLAGVNPPNQSNQQQNPKQPKQPVVQVSGLYGSGFGGGQTGPFPGAPGHGASSGWGDEQQVIPPPAAAIPTPTQLPPVPQMQLTPPQVQPQYQLGQPQMYYSDQNLKTNISNTSKSDIKKFMNSISQPKNYDYKDPTNGTHTKGGLMAQDLEKSNIGKSVVINTPKGKAVDTAKLATILASVTAHRFNELEQKMEKALNKKFKKGKR